jgi:hypothetical protein
MPSSPSLQAGLVIAVADRVLSLPEEDSKIRLALRQWPRNRIAPLEVQQIKDD